MIIHVDADACPSKSLIEEICVKYEVELVYYCCFSNVFYSTQGKTILVDDGFQSVDMKIANSCKQGDIVITQDYGVASMVLGMGCLAINPNGIIYDEYNIDQMLETRYLSAKVRRGGGRVANAKKRDYKDETRLKQNLERLIQKILFKGGFQR
ncbi:hypothetical protein SAMN02745248_01515 [Hathewaya proteolytica DSM 3090]|uniref:UPF0178 protein SAMN02745248_01515 n=1 Tax=Hathewaya proteolytica DSM 3090 TaxID=1121331 RepID=A0A1M6NVQ2_9CLOT|nr:YaiI/YqxD family protein [Hathewaya proteolytica]SHJ99718.1 hypothetical protein SAMN02745248_01515 [Hathewaya proteolytica DSM 3090]